MRRILVPVLAAFSLAGTAALAQSAPADKPVYVFLYRAGPAWQPGKPMAEQGLGPHAAYIKTLLDQGKLFAGGATGPDTGMAIVRAGSLEEAKAMLAADPAITSGVFAADLRAWAPRFDSRRPLRP